MRVFTLTLSIFILVWRYKVYSKEAAYQIPPFHGPKYIAVNVKVSQPMAMHVCQLFDMQLISVQNEAKNDEIIKAASQYGINGSKEYLWTSASKHFGFWKWSDGTPFTYTNWGELEPNNFQKNEFCLQLELETGKWNDHPCEETHYFACEHSRREDNYPCQQSVSKK